MTKRRFRTFHIVLVFLTVPGCLGTVSRVHIDDEPVKDVEASDVDLRAMAREMAEHLLELEIVKQHPGAVKIAFLTFSNRTLTVDFDSNNLQSLIRTQIVSSSNGKILFLDRELSDAIYAERDAKRSGQRTSSKREDLPGADLFLKGEAYSMRKADTKGRISAYHRYSFRLTDTETGVVVWERAYEFKKHGRRGAVYR